MELAAFIDDLRSAYVQEFVATFSREKAKNADFFSEIGLEISGSVHKGLYVVDFVRRVEGSNTVVELGETPRTFRGPASFSIGGMPVEFDSVSWDAVEVSAEPTIIWSQDLEAWFERWLDTEKTPKDGDVVTGIIHSVAITDSGVQIDFGTAPPEAALELISLIRENGARSIHFGNARE